MALPPSFPVPTAYGQTGSGKTFSTFGSEDGNWEHRGIIPRSVEYLMGKQKGRRRAKAVRPSRHLPSPPPSAERAEQVKAQTGRQFQFYVSFLEIYLDRIRDLGRGAAGSLKTHKVRIHPYGPCWSPRRNRSAGCGCESCCIRAARGLCCLRPLLNGTREEGPLPTRLLPLPAQTLLPTLLLSPVPLHSSTHASCL